MQKLELKNENLHKEREKARKKLTETIEKYSEKADVTIKSQFSHNLTDIKPELGELSKKYSDPDFDEHFGDREYPEDEESVGCVGFQGSYAGGYDKDRHCSRVIAQYVACLSAVPEPCPVIEFTVFGR